jgi:hypothetical protein
VSLLEYIQVSLDHQRDDWKLGASLRGKSMRLATLYVRFYKSFNYDRVRKARLNGVPRGDWELYREQWFPYVEIRIDPKLTTVVGANESGKSHLLGAIEKAVTGEGFMRRDLCRYCPFFGVTEEQSAWPHLGVAWTDVAPEEVRAIREVIGGEGEPFSEFMMFREGPDELVLWTPVAGGGWLPHHLTDIDVQGVTAVLPRPYRIHSDVALPDAVPFAALVADAPRAPSRTNRRARASLLEQAGPLADLLGADASSIAANAGPLLNMLRPFAQAMVDGPTPDDQQSVNLARGLLFHLARIEPERIRDLAEAIADGEDGYANALTQSINDQLERALNLRKWWAQDRDFSLRIAPREHELVFTIRDRTGTEYTFAERSSGLKYFLSYLIQAQAHRPSEARERILLMDEPDTYLSAEAQQDLMRILRDLSEEQADRPAVQVIYVTHSPFLIDKNHAARIRVLEKGRGLDGTRVVSNVSQNHYEPLRSAFGAFVGETAFVGSVNLLVEGVADQVILAGASRALRRLPHIPENDLLDLNRLTIVPCGSASHVPYMVYLVRGRDAEKPPVVVLLDSDTAGNDAARALRRDKILRGLIPTDHVLQLAEASGRDQTSELEDLIPLPLAVAAANRCLGELTRYRQGRAHDVAEADITRQREAGDSMFDAILGSLPNGVRIEKLAFARAIVEICEDPEAALAEPVGAFLGSMRALFRVLNRARRDAERESGRERIGQMVERQARLFARDHPSAARREEALNQLEEIEGLLDSSQEADAVRAAMQQIRRDHRLDEEPGEPISDLIRFKGALDALNLALDIERLPPDPTPDVEAAAPGEQAPAEGFNGAPGEMA